MSKKHSLIMVLVACLALPAGLVADTDIDIPYTEFELKNGLRVIVHEDRKAPIVAVNIWYHVGSKNEKPGKTGFAHLFEHLMYNGSENYNDEFFKPFDRVGATAQNGTTWLDRTNYFQNVPSTALDLALWMESDRMGHLLGAVTQERLDEQRGVVQNEKRQRENQPYGKVYEAIQRNLFPEGHPYAWTTIGSMEDLEAASLDDVHEWFKTYYGPNNAVLVLAGDVSVEDARAKAEHYFGDIPPGPPVSKYELWAPKLRESSRLVMQDRVPQARLYQNWVGPAWGSEDAVLLQLAGAVLANGKTSRLYQRLVYEEQIATAVDATPTFAEIAGFLGIEASVQPGGDLAAVEVALDEELARFLDDGPQRDELERARTQIRASLIRGLEEVGGFAGKAQLLARNATYAGDPGYHRTMGQYLDQATVRSVRDAARRWFSAGRFTVEVHPFPSLQAAAEGAERANGPPMPDSFPEVGFDKFQRSELSNGLQLLLVQRDAVPVVDFSLVLDAGYAADANTRMGTANLALSMLDEGTGKLDALEISDRLAQLGATLSASSNLDQSIVQLSALSQNLQESLELYADVVLNPSFPENELARLKKQVLAGIQREQASPFALAQRIMPRLLYEEGHPYSIPFTGTGTAESVAGIDRNSLQAFHDAWFRPNNATMIIVGDTSLQAVKPMLEKLFGGWEARALPDKPLADAQSAADERVFIVDRPDSEQSLIIAAQVVPGGANSPDELALQAMNDVLGGTFTARVNMNLREDKAWAYGAYTFVLSGKGPRPYIAYAPVQSDKTADSMAELKQEIVAIQQQRPVQQAELDRVRDDTVLSLPGQWETGGAVAGSLAEMLRFGYPDDYWSQYAHRVRGLSLDAVQAAAQRYLQPERLLWVIVGDRKKIQAQVESLGYRSIQFLTVDGTPAER